MAFPQLTPVPYQTAPVLPSPAPPPPPPRRKRISSVRQPDRKPGSQPGHQPAAQRLLPTCPLPAGGPRPPLQPIQVIANPLHLRPESLLHRPPPPPPPPPPLPERAAVASSAAVTVFLAKGGNGSYTMRKSVGTADRGAVARKPRSLRRRLSSYNPFKRTSQSPASTERDDDAGSESRLPSDPYLVGQRARRDTVLDQTAPARPNDAPIPLPPSLRIGRVGSAPASGPRQRQHRPKDHTGSRPSVIEAPKSHSWQATEMDAAATAAATAWGSRSKSGSGIPRRPPQRLERETSGAALEHERHRRGGSQVARPRLVSRHHRELLPAADQGRPAQTVHSPLRDDPEALLVPERRPRLAAREQKRQSHSFPEQEPTHISHQPKPPPTLKSNLPPNPTKPPNKQNKRMAQDRNFDPIPHYTLEFDKLYARMPPNTDKTFAFQIYNEATTKIDMVKWSDVAGLNTAKRTLKEAIVYPMLRPDLYTGLRQPSKGLLLFGPPGTGKTMLARAVATESKSTFLSISASSLYGKYYGESEKTVRALFAVAKAMAPSVVFVDEIDSILSARGGQAEGGTSQRMKTEFLIQWSNLSTEPTGKLKKGSITRAYSAGTNGASSGSSSSSCCGSSQNSSRSSSAMSNQVASQPSTKINGKEPARTTPVDRSNQVLVLGATNLPWNIDDAAIRRFSRRQYIPLPDDESRQAQIKKLLSIQEHRVSAAQIGQLTAQTKGYSSSDITNLMRDAALEPLRQLGDEIESATAESVRPLQYKDIVNSCKSIRPSVPPVTITRFADWARQYGESGK